MVSLEVHTTRPRKRLELFNRRRFLAGVAAGCAAQSLGCGPPETDDTIPSFLQGYEAPYGESPHAAALDWFQDAGLALSFRYGVYRQLAANEWVQFDNRVPAADYERLIESFDPSGFDAHALADLAIEAGAHYLRFPARLADGFCLFRTNETAFTSLDSPARRDLVQETCEACAAKSLGLFLEYSYALDWRHPYFYPPGSVKLDWPHAGLDEGLAHPLQFQADEDFLHYIRYAHVQLKEILYRYVPLAGIALTPVMGFYARPDLFPIATTYEIIHEAQPQVLLSFEQGADGEEDFTSVRAAPGPHPKGGKRANAVWETNRTKPVEILVDTVGAEAMTPSNTERPAAILLESHLLETGAVEPQQKNRLLKAAGRLRSAAR